jgi:hypothetical protein
MTARALAAIDADPEMWHGLTIWTDSISLQVRDDTVALHVSDDARRSTEDHHPVILTAAEALRIRDLLNVATARGFL